MRALLRPAKRNYVPRPHLRRQHRVRNDLNLELVDVTNSRKLRHMGKHLPYIELHHELGEIPHLAHYVLPEGCHCHPVHRQRPIYWHEVEISGKHTWINLQECGSGHLRKITNNFELLVRIVELLAIQNHPRGESANSHRTDILRYGFQPIDPESCGGSNLSCSCSGLADSSEHLLIDPGDPFPEGLHRFEIRHISPRNICDRDLVEELRNICSIRLGSETVNEARSTIFGVIDDNFTWVNDELIIKAGSHVVEMGVDEPIHCSLNRINNLRKSSCV